jgi:hypothetical protein
VAKAFDLIFWDKASHPNFSTSWVSIISKVTPCRGSLATGVGGSSGSAIVVLRPAVGGRAKLLCVPPCVQESLMVSQKVVKLTICQCHLNLLPGVPAAVERFLRNRQPLACNRW